MSILFKNATVWSPEPLGVQDLLVLGGRIEAIGSLGDPPASWPVEVVDLSGAHLVPGLVDLHAHIGGGGGEGGAHTRVPAVPLSTFTAAGVTTVVGLLGTDATTRSLADLLAAARALDHGGITALCYTGAYEVPPPSLTGSIRGDIVHIDRIIGVGELAISDHRSSQPTFDELARIAADCHVSGLMTGKAGFLHLHLGDGPRGLELVRRILTETELPTRVLHPTHLNRSRALWAEALELGRTHGLRGDVTAFPASEDPDELSAADAILSWLEAGNPSSNLTCSSDGGGCLPTFDADGTLTGMDVGSPATLLDTVRSLVHKGLPLGQAVAALTKNPAELARLTTKGRIEVGADADLVVLDASLGLRHTVARGCFLVRDEKPQVHGPFERGG